MNTFLLDLFYLAAAILFILGLKGLNSPETARRGLMMAEIGMALAIIGTLLHNEIVQFQWILVGVTVGSAIGALMAIFMPYTEVARRPLSCACAARATFGREHTRCPWMLHGGRHPRAYVLTHAAWWQEAICVRHASHSR
jgi:hypothetical protein